jgi:hypothetical protein
MITWGVGVFLLVVSPYRESFVRPNDGRRLLERTGVFLIPALADRATGIGG